MSTVYTFGEIIPLTMIDFVECEPGWDLIGSKCYNIYRELMNYTSAASVCRNKGGVLASLINRKQQKELACKSGK